MSQIDSSQSIALESVRDPIARRAAAKLGMSPPGQPGTARAKWRPIYDYVTIVNGGTTHIDFLAQNAPTKFQGNYKQANKLTTRGVYRVLGLGFKFYPLGTGREKLAVAATPFPLAEALIRMIEEAYLEVKLDEETILTDLGLENYPAGGGTHVLTSAATTASTTTDMAAVVNNGVPDVNNRFYFPTPFDLTQDNQLFVTLDYNAAVAFPGSATGAVKCTIFGFEVVNATR